MKATLFQILSLNKKESLEVLGLASDQDLFLGYIIFKTNPELFITKFGKGFYISRRSTDPSENYKNHIEPGIWFKVLKKDFKVESNQIVIQNKHYIGSEIKQRWYENPTVQFLISSIIGLISLFLGYFSLK